MGVTTTMVTVMRIEVLVEAVARSCAMESTEVELFTSDASESADCR